MNGMKGKLVKRLKSIPRVLQVKPQDRLLLQVNASDHGYVENIPNTSVVKFHKQTEKKKNNNNIDEQQLPDVIDVDELMRDLLTDDSEDEIDDDDKENFAPRTKTNVPVSSVESKLMQSKATFPDSDAVTLPEKPLSEIDISSFRRPDIYSGTLFDPGLLAAFRQAVTECMKWSEAERIARTTEAQNEIVNNETEPEPDPLLPFEEKHPPGSFESVILYTTSLRGIRKTFDDCNSIRFLLESFRVVYFERDVSMHMEFRQELWNILDSKSVPPKLFIKGRYIGGAEEVLALHEQGKLRPLLAGVPLDRSEGPCQGCAAVRFVVCFKCSGSHKLIAEDGESNVCPQCNENGLIMCPYCC
ncbi:uncharacterized protein At3g28850-like [Argentina anserina]|uniref:uncharacterized protein At3g28850-like n=1 Tax=Argentina anserina TaxID=57926 RepID=UPI002176364D|nr:uncharacterized protein At3g28850-like [Potentilla anserina]